MTLYKEELFVNANGQVRSRQYHYVKTVENNTITYQIKKIENGDQEQTIGRIVINLDSNSYEKKYSVKTEDTSTPNSILAEISAWMFPDSQSKVSKLIGEPNRLYCLDKDDKRIFQYIYTDEKNKKNKNVEASEDKYGLDISTWLNHYETAEEKNAGSEVALGKTTRSSRRLVMGHEKKKKKKESKKIGVEEEKTKVKEGEGGDVNIPVDYIEIDDDEENEHQMDIVVPVVPSRIFAYPKTDPSPNSRIVLASESLVPGLSLVSHTPDRDYAYEEVFIDNDGNNNIHVMQYFPNSQLLKVSLDNRFNPQKIFGSIELSANGNGVKHMTWQGVKLGDILDLGRSSTSPYTKDLIKMEIDYMEDSNPKMNVSPGQFKAKKLRSLILTDIQESSENDIRMFLKGILPSHTDIQQNSGLFCIQLDGDNIGSWASQITPSKLGSHSLDIVLRYQKNTTAWRTKCFTTIDLHDNHIGSEVIALENVGNTCWMTLAAFLLGREPSRTMLCTLFPRLKDFVEKYYNQSGGEKEEAGIILRQFIESDVYRTGFLPSHEIGWQQDATEFFQKIQEYRFCEIFFRNPLELEFICMNCRVGGNYTVSEPDFRAQVKLKDEYLTHKDTIKGFQDILARYRHDDVCPTCMKKPDEEIEVMGSFLSVNTFKPRTKYFVIHLSRVSAKVDSYGKRSKLEYKYEFDQTLFDKEYHLVCIVRHMGEMFGGHWIRYERNQNNVWYKVNDNVLSKIEDVKKEVMDNSELQRSAVCLVYEQQET